MNVSQCLIFEFKGYMNPLICRIFILPFPSNSVSSISNPPDREAVQNGSGPRKSHDFSIKSLLDFLLFFPYLLFVSIDKRLCFKQNATLEYQLPQVALRRVQFINFQVNDQVIVFNQLVSSKFLIEFLIIIINFSLWNIPSNENSECDYNFFYTERLKRRKL